MKKRFLWLWIVIGVCFACGAMALVECVISPNYVVKSSIKLFLFLGIPLACYFGNRKEFSPSLFLKIGRRGLLWSGMLGLIVYGIILGAFFLLRPYFDFSRVIAALEQNEGFNKVTFLVAAIYIAFFNSFLEEFFFRGFAFLFLRKSAGRTFAYLFSSLIFAGYHVAIIASWFTLDLFLLLMAGLWIAGLLFDWLDEKWGNIYCSWAVHLCANLAINTIGLILFGIL